MAQISTYDTKKAHNMWHDNYSVWIACDPDNHKDLEPITEAHQFVDADGHMFVIDVSPWFIPDCKKG